MSEEKIAILERKRTALKAENNDAGAKLALLRENVKSGQQTSQQVAYQRKLLIKKKASIQKDLGAIAEEIKSINRISSLVSSGYKTEYLACRDLLREAMKLLRDFKDNGFMAEKAVDFSNEVTAFLMEIPV